MYGSVTTPDDLLLLLHRFQALTIFQIVRLIRKETSINNVRSKLKRLVDNGFVETQYLPRTTPSGSTPMMYSLSSKGTKYIQGTGGVAAGIGQKTRGVLPLQHLLEINDVLISSLLLPTVAPEISVLEFVHERIYKQNPICITQGSYLCPDGFTHFVLSPPFGKPDEPMGIIWEVDRNTEDAFIIREKIRDYCKLFYGDCEQIFGTTVLCVVFVVTLGGNPRVKQLRRAAELELDKSHDDGELFLFGAHPPAEIAPLQFFTSPVWIQPFQSSPVSLIESRS